MLFAVRRRFARIFYGDYVEAPRQKFIQSNVQKSKSSNTTSTAKGTVLDCRKEKAGARSLQDPLKT